MRLPIVAPMALAIVSLSTPALAQGVAIDSAVYQESARGAAVRIEPATRLLRGDRVITILRWDAPDQGRYTVTSAVPAGLAIESTSHQGLEVSLDGGRNWRRLADSRAVPAGTTHLRWQLSGDGRLSYRAVVR